MRSACLFAFTFAAIVAAFSPPLETTMPSSYRQPSYEIPFNAAAPAGGRGNPLDDSFAQLRPQAYEIDDATVAIPGYVGLDAKWNLWDEGEVLDFAAIDPRIGMCLLQTSGDKQWCGAFQQFPIPTVNGQILQAAIYMRAQFAFFDSEGGTTGTIPALNYGLILGQNLLAAPDTSQLLTIGGQFQQVYSDGPNSAGILQAANFAGYDGVLGVGGAWSAGFPSATYFRIRSYAKRNGASDYDGAYGFDASVNGTDWICVYQTTLAESAPNLFESIGFGVRSADGVTFGAYFSDFSVVSQDLGDYTPMSGGTQQLGPV